MTIRTRLVEYTHEGTTLEGFLAWDDAITGRRPAVAVNAIHHSPGPCTRNEPVARSPETFSSLRRVVPSTS